MQGARHTLSLQLRAFAHAACAARLQRYSFDAMRCSACRAVYYCGSDCQRRDWTAGGHRLVCVAAPRRPERPAGRAMLDEMEVTPW